MKLPFVIVLSTIAICSISDRSNSAEITSCHSTFRMTSQATGESPGSLSTSVNTPCRWAVHLNGAVRGAPLGRAAGLTIVQQPQNGQARPDSKASFVFTPKPGFSGNDTMIMRFNWLNGASAIVRFAISVS